MPTIEIRDERIGDEHEKSSEPGQCSSPSLPKLVKQMEKQVDKTGQFFLVVRRGAAFQRSSLWQRTCKATSPQKLIRVKYMGESGIDTGAMTKEFLSDVIVQMGSAMFPNGAPVDSVYDSQNGNFRSCGEIAGTSIVQEGPAPRFLDKTTYNMLVKPEIDMTS